MRRVSAEKVVAVPFRTLAEAQCEHVELVAQAQGLEGRFLNALPGEDRNAAVELARLRRQIRAFEWRLAATGARMPDGNARSFAQSLLDFWALRQADLRVLASKFRPKTWKASRPMAASPAAGRLLLPYDDATATEAASQAEAIYQALPDDAAREAAKTAFVSLGLDGTGSAGLATMPAPFIEGGIVVHQTAEPSAAALMFAHEALPTAWSRLSEWLGEARQKQADLDRFRYDAEAWVETGSVAELPRGSAIDKVAQYAGTDEAISKYVGAALKRRTFERVVAGVVIAGTMTLMVLAVMPLFREPALPPVQEDDESTSAAVVGQEEQSRQLDVALDADPTATELIPEEERDKTGVTGWIWVGYDGKSQVVSEENPKLPIGQIKAGSLLRPLVNLKVRDAPSDSAGIAGRRQAGVSSGSLVVALSDIRPSTVKGTTQYWLRVRLIPQVYVQLDTESQVDAEALRRALSDNGFAVPDAQKLPNIARRGSPAFDVRYYYEQDRTAAESARLIAAEALDLGEGTVTPLVGTPLAERVKTGTIEVWLFRP